jgi:glutamine---fructose-6-phosphate transaminase (isomerizing)
LYTHAGPEIGVASTKTFLATLTAIYLLGVALGRARGHLTAVDARKRLDELVEMPELVATTLQLEPRARIIARSLLRAQSLLYLGRGIHHPIALEGALKLKELSYSHAEGYAGGEMKHGPIALLTEGFPVVALVLRDQTYDRMLANIQEARARGARVIAVCHGDDAEVARLATHTLPVPAAADLLTPLLSTIPLQLLAYHLATLRGHDVDQPRNLAKSVTVE